MERLVDALERRDHPRRSGKLPCRLLANGRPRPGVVCNLSAHGLFVETPEELAPGTGVLVAFRAPQGPRFVLQASAPRSSTVAHSLLGLAPAGIALLIQDPPPAYLRWVEGASPPTS
jgi:hypothetical protein